MRSCAVALISVALLCGCPGEPVEGSGSADGGSTSSDGSTSVTASNTITVGSQSATDSSDGSNSVSVSATDTSGDPTSVTLTDTGTPDTGSQTTDASDTTASAETSTSAAETTTEGGSTESGTCVDPNEPNDSEGTATPLAEIACDGQADVDDVADDATGPDWFAFHGAYNDGCGTGTEDDALPRAQASDGLPVCVFVTCTAAMADIDCLHGAFDMSPGGLAGCCGDGDAQASVNCPNGSDESTDVLVQVDTSGTDCLEYTLQLSF